MNNSCILLFALIGCLLCSPALGVSLRFAHGAPNMAPVNVFVDGDLKWSSIEYSWVTDSIDYSSDSPVLIEIYTDSTNILLLSFEVPLQVATSVALLDTGDNTPDYSIYLDVVEAKAPSRSSNVQIISLLPFGTSISITRSRSSTPFATGVTALEQVMYSSTSAGFTAFSFDDDVSGDHLMTSTASLRAGSYSTLWMFGDSTEDDFVVTISDDSDHVDMKYMPYL